MVSPVQPVSVNTSNRGSSPTARLGTIRRRVVSGGNPDMQGLGAALQSLGQAGMQIGAHYYRQQAQSDAAAEAQKQALQIEMAKANAELMDDAEVPGALTESMKNGDIMQIRALRERMGQIRKAQQGSSKDGDKAKQEDQVKEMLLAGAVSGATGDDLGPGSSEELTKGQTLFEVYQGSAGISTLSGEERKAREGQVIQDVYRRLFDAARKGESRFMSDLGDGMNQTESTLSDGAEGLLGGGVSRMKNLFGPMRQTLDDVADTNQIIRDTSGTLIGSVQRALRNEALVGELLAGDAGIPDKVRDSFQELHREFQSAGSDPVADDKISDKLEKLVQKKEVQEFISSRLFRPISEPQSYRDLLNADEFGYIQPPVQSAGSSDVLRALLDREFRDQRFPPEAMYGTGVK